MYFRLPDTAVKTGTIMIFTGINRNFQVLTINGSRGWKNYFVKSRPLPRQTVSR